MLLVPPSSLPRGKCIVRLAAACCGSVEKPQSSFVRHSVPEKPGTVVRQSPAPPASISVTLTPGSSLSRAASTQPADPAPTTM